MHTIPGIHTIMILAGGLALLAICLLMGWRVSRAEPRRLGACSATVENSEGSHVGRPGEGSRVHDGRSRTNHSKEIEMPFEPVPLDHEFTAPIGVDVQGELWACVEMPGSAEFFGTGRAVRVDASVDGVPLDLRCRRSHFASLVSARPGRRSALSARPLR